MAGRYDLVDCLHDYRLSVKVHGDEILNHANWEISVCWSPVLIRPLLNSCVAPRKSGSDVTCKSKIYVSEDPKADGDAFIVCSLTRRRLNW